jgi:hypothetical protein
VFAAHSLSKSFYPSIHPAHALLQDFGKFGYIRETDAHAKHNEFVLWLVEVKGANIELLGKTEEKEMFREYMEDFNTGTLPHR